MKQWFLDLWRSLFPHDKWVRWVLTGFVLVFLWAAATKARAADYSFEGGVQYLRGPAAVVTTQVAVPGPGDSEIETGLFLVGRTPDHLGVMGGQVLLVDGFKKFDIGLGLAYMNRDHEQLGSRLNFTLMLRYRFDRWYVSIRHWSNAGTTEENTGLDVVTIGRRF